MKKTFLILMGVCFLFAPAAVAEWGFGYSSKTGDAGLDVSLENLNVSARGNLEEFITDISINYGVPKIKVENLLNEVNMPPSDIYMAVKTASVAKQPLDDVVTQYQKDKGKGWGQIAKKLGIKPGSKEFHLLKSDDSGMLEKAKKNNSSNNKGKGKGKGKKKK